MGTLGVTCPSGGTAFIAGMDIRTSLPAIRKQLGLCPQYNILFGSLTVMEHLKFFCKLKGRVWDEADAVDIINRLKIGFKRDAFASTLSGGQKRKLSLAIALIGGSEVCVRYFIESPDSDAGRADVGYGPGCQTRDMDSATAGKGTENDAAHHTLYG